LDDEHDGKGISSNREDTGIVEHKGCPEPIGEQLFNREKDNVDAYIERGVSSTGKQALISIVIEHLYPLYTFR
jgi:hypothetical protein